jgi:hypothetical protein
LEHSCLDRHILPSLLRKSGKFICYRGDERVGIGDYRTLMAECNRRGFRDNEFVIALIGPTAGSEEEEEIDRRPPPARSTSVPGSR